MQTLKELKKQKILNVVRHTSHDNKTLQGVVIVRSKDTVFQPENHQPIYAAELKKTTLTHDAIGNITGWVNPTAGGNFATYTLV